MKSGLHRKTKQKHGWEARYVTGYWSHSEAWRSLYLIWKAGGGGYCSCVWQTHWPQCRENDRKSGSSKRNSIGWGEPGMLSTDKQPRGLGFSWACPHDEGMRVGWVVAAAAKTVSDAFVFSTRGSKGKKHVRSQGRSKWEPSGTTLLCWFQHSLMSALRKQGRWISLSLRSAWSTQERPCKCKRSEGWSPSSWCALWRGDRRSSVLHPKD